MLFSIIVPFRNRAGFLPETLSSIYLQRYRPLELILVDNASTDASADLCRQFAERHADGRFQVRLLSEPDGGAAKARNRGLAAANGEYVYFFDSDDIMSPEFISDVCLAVDKHRPDVVAAATCMTFSNGKSKRRKVYHTCSVQDQILTGMLSTQSIVVRTNFLRGMGGWAEDVVKWNDWELGVRLLLKKPRIHWIRGKAYHQIRQHPDSLTGSSFSERIDDIRHALSTVEAQIAHQPRAILALQARKAILAGQLIREHSPAPAAVLLAEATSGASGRNNLLFKLLYRYCACAGKGGWLVYRTFSFLWH